MNSTMSKVGGKSAIHIWYRLITSLYVEQQDKVVTVSNNMQKELNETDKNWGRKKNGQRGYSNVRDWENLVRERHIKVVRNLVNLTGRNFDVCNFQFLQIENWSSTKVVETCQDHNYIIVFVVVSHRTLKWLRLSSSGNAAREHSHPIKR